MKLPLLILLTATQYSGAPSPAQSIRVAYANQLFMDTIGNMVANHEDVSSLVVEIHGEYGQVLYIRDDAASAKAFYTFMSGDEYTRANLLRMGFKMVVLVNASHGTFVIDLMTNGLVKEDPQDA